MGPAIVKAIDQCRAMVLIFSASANNSEAERSAARWSAPSMPARPSIRSDRKRRPDGSDGLLHEHGYTGSMP